MGNQGTTSGDRAIFRSLPRRRAERRSTAPSLVCCSGALYVLDLLMRHRVYIAFQVSQDGGVLGVTILDGEKRERAWCHTDGELGELFTTLAQRYETTLEEP